VIWLGFVIFVSLCFLLPLVPQPSTMTLKSLRNTIIAPNLRFSLLTALKFGLGTMLMVWVLLMDSFGSISRTLVIGSIFFFCYLDAEEKKLEEEEEKEEQQAIPIDALILRVKSVEDGRFKKLQDYFEGLKMSDIPYLKEGDILKDTSMKDLRLMKIFLRKHLDMVK